MEKVILMKESEFNLLQRRVKDASIDAHLLLQRIKHESNYDMNDISSEISAIAMQIDDARQVLKG